MCLWRMCVCMYVIGCEYVYVYGCVCVCMYDRMCVCLCLCAGCEFVCVRLSICKNNLAKKLH